MAGERRWYLVSYDVRDQGRLRRVHALLKGFGVSVQYSIFRCRLSTRHLERLRWELEKVLESEDALMIVGLCGDCLNKVVLRNPRQEWQVQDAPRFQII